MMFQQIPPERRRRIRLDGYDLRSYCAIRLLIVSSHGLSKGANPDGRNHDVRSGPAC